MLWARCPVLGCRVEGICLPRWNPIESGPCKLGWTKTFASVTVEWMRASGNQRERRRQPDPIDFVRTQELDRARQQIERQQREIERLRQEGERLRKELEAALRAGKRQAAPHSRGKPKDNPKRPAANQARITASTPAPGCRSSVPIAETGSSFSPANRNIRKRLYGGLWCAALTSPWAAAAVVAAGCKGGIGWRLPMRWAWARSNWGPRRWRRRRFSTSRWVCRWGIRDKYSPLASGWKLVAADCIGRWHEWRGARRCGERAQ